MTIFDRDFDNLLLPPATKEKVKKGEIKKPKKQSGTGFLVRHITNTLTTF